MTLLVRPDTQNKSRGTLSFGAATYPCALGRGGVSENKTEGDGATPVGAFALRRLFYRADRLSAPRTILTTTAIQPHDGWCDAPKDANYNMHVRLPYRAGAEQLWLEERVYDLIVVLGHNDAPVVPHKGSAIFMHVATPDFSPTAGCVALSQTDLLAVLEKVSADTQIRILPG
jgi:L,D-peptidoglycan transpeptidase YkuD (ErfK/YbiS/YcfS/YnhG family)